MTGRKTIKEVQTKGTPAGGGFSVFQLLIFLIATSSMAMNFAMLYGLIPIQGINIHYFSKLKHFFDLLSEI